MVSKSLHIIKKNRKKTGLSDILDNMEKYKNQSFRVKLDDETIIESGVSEQ